MFDDDDDDSTGGLESTALGIAGAFAQSAIVGGTTYTGASAPIGVMPTSGSGNGLLILLGIVVVSILGYFAFFNRK